MNRLSLIIIRLKYIILIVTVALTVTFSFFLKDLTVDADVFNYLPEDDPKAELFTQVGIRYGGNYTGVIGLEAADVFTTATLNQIRMVTDSLRRIPGVGTVTSLTNIIDIKGSDWGIEIGNLVDQYHLPETPEELEALRAYTLSQDMYRGSIVSEDATLTAILVKIMESQDKIAVAGKIMDKVNSMDLPQKTYFGGMPFAIKSLGDIILGDLLFLAPLTAIVIILVLFLSFRSWRGVILPLLTVGISITWTLGIMSIMDITISIISDVIPVILLAVGSAYTIHVINRVNYASLSGGNGEENLQKALAYIIVPVFLAAATTMAGFISFIFGSYLTMISTFGIFMALGVAFALILSVTFAPALMAISPQLSKPRKPLRTKGKPILDRFLSVVDRWVFRHPWRVVLAWSGILAAAVAGSFLIQRNVDIINYFKPSDPTYVAESIIREKFGGSMPVYLTVRGDVKDPENLRIMDRAAEFMESTGMVVNTQSVADLIEKMNEVMGEGNSIPAERDKVEQLWFMLEGQDIMEQLVTYEKDEALVHGTFTSGDVSDMDSFNVKMQGFIDSEPSLKEKVDFTGLTSLYMKIDRSLINSQMQSLIYAFLLVLLLVGFILRSFRRGLQVGIPILATLTVLFGFMGLAGISLDIATVLVGSVSIGIGVDYAIHMITHFDHELKQHGDPQTSLGKSIAISGRAIVINVLSVTMGFLVLLLSNLVPLERFGLLVAVTMITSGAAAITLLPAVLVLTSKSTEIKNKEE